MLYEEAKYSFVYAQFMATILLSLAAVERALAGRFYSADPGHQERMPLREILAKAHERGWLDQGQFKHLNDLRDLRNELTHFRRPLGEQLTPRAIREGLHPYDLLEDDAQNAIKLLHSVLLAAPL